MLPTPSLHDSYAAQPRPTSTPPRMGHESMDSYTARVQVHRRAMTEAGEALSLGDRLYVGFMLERAEITSKVVQVSSKAVRHELHCLEEQLSRGPARRAASPEGEDESPVPPGVPRGSCASEPTGEPPAAASAPDRGGDDSGIPHGLTASS